MHRWLIAGLGLLSAAPALAQSAGPQVQAPAGALRGMAEPGGNVEAFLGVPYAQAPVGPLRWREPKTLGRWTGVRDATQFGARCMQLPLFSDMAFRSPPSSEDCLFLNVWRPAGTHAGAKLPVLVFIYGGGFQAGDASEKRYDGASIAARGALVVTVNYRLGVFGFLAHPGLAAESPHHAAGNYGLLDQAAALAWVKRNVQAFGGDPRHVTVGGESAGSMSVSGLMASPLSRKLIAGAIGESGALMNPVFRLAPLAEAEAAGQGFAASVGAADLPALRAMPADALLAAQGQSKASFGPVLDGYFLTEEPTVTFAAGRQARVPLLVGFNSQENSYQNLLGSRPATLAGYRDAVTQMFGQAADQVLQLYPAASDADVPAAAQALASDRFLAHPTWKWAELQRRSGAPVYLYQYRRIRPPALAAPTAPGQAPLGAVHSAEIEYALGNLDTNPAYAWTADDRTVSATMEGYWVNFIKTGNPNGPGLPAWPAAGTGPVPTRAVIDVTTRAQPLAEQSRYQAMDTIFTPR